MDEREMEQQRRGKIASPSPGGEPCAREHRQNKKPGQAGRALLTQLNTSRTKLLARRGLRDISLERLIGLLGEIGIELADLGRLRDETLVGRLGVVGLDLNRLLDRLHAEELF